MLQTQQLRLSHHDIRAIHWREGLTLCYSSLSGVRKQRCSKRCPFTKYFFTMSRDIDEHLEDNGERISFNLLQRFERIFKTFQFRSQCLFLIVARFVEYLLKRNVTYT